MVDEESISRQLMLKEALVGQLTTQALLYKWKHCLTWNKKEMDWCMDRCLSTSNLWHASPFSGSWSNFIQSTLLEDRNAISCSRENISAHPFLKWSHTHHDGNMFLLMNNSIGCLQDTVKIDCDGIPGSVTTELELVTMIQDSPREPKR